MSNPKNTQNNQNQNQTTTTLSPSQFSHALTTTAISQILCSIGFKSSKSTALNTLSRLTSLFIQSLATTAAAHAASSSRTHSNIFDIMYSIELHSLPFGFPGASAINQPLGTSKTLQELTYFIDQLPFSRRLRFNDSASSSVIFAGELDRSWNKDDDRRGIEVPRWLPPFPEVRSDDCKGIDGKECLWEEKKVECGVAVGKNATKRKRGKEVVVQGRRERVKFRLGISNRNSKVGSGGGLDDFELRNGVCRGGKRVSLIQNVGDNDITRFFQDDAL